MSASRYPKLCAFRTVSRGSPRPLRSSASAARTRSFAATRMAFTGRLLVFYLALALVVLYLLIGVQASHGA